MCVTVDYVLVPEGRAEAFVSLAQDAMARMAPSYTTNPQSTGIVNDRNLDRLLSYLDDARRKGGRVIALGGACVNAAAIHATVPSLPFGGIGYSGMGRHHGFEGFLTFSHQKAVFRPGLGYIPSIVYPPYGKKLDRIIGWLLRRVGLEALLDRVDRPRA